MKQTAYEMDSIAAMEDSNDNSVRGLSKKEKELFKILSDVKGERLMAISIRTRISSGSIRGFREMIIELKDQMGDCGRERMIEIIGIDGVKLLEVL